MSYEKVRSIKIDEDAQKVFINCASNNVRPLSYTREEYPSFSKILREEGREAVEIRLLKLYDGGELQGGSNKFTRALKALRYALKDEYFKFDWVHNWEESKTTRETKEFEDLLLKALRFKIPKTKYIICKPYNCGVVYGKVMRNSITWSLHKDEATKHDFRGEAEKVLTCFKNNDFFIEEIGSRGGLNENS